MVSGQAKQEVSAAAGSDGAGRGCWPASILGECFEDDAVLDIDVNGDEGSAIGLPAHPYFDVVGVVLESAAVAAEHSGGSSREQLIQKNQALREENTQLWNWLSLTIEFLLVKQHEFSAVALAMGLSLTQIAILLALLLITTARKKCIVGQAFQPDSEPCQAGKPDLLLCRGNRSQGGPGSRPDRCGSSWLARGPRGGDRHRRLAWATRPLPKFEPVGTTGRPAEPRPELQARTPDRDYLGILTGLPILGRRPFAPGPHGPAMTKGWSSCYDRGMMRPSTRRILGRPIDAFEGVVTGYIITIDGRIWSRLTTRDFKYLNTLS